MADGILYLDVDDEITSAAARVRGVAGGRVAVVLPYGSRVATSRINFRLLARDALTHEKRLSIIASDSATRALAASAGLPVFATVQEYEASLPPAREEPVEPAPTPAASAAAIRKAKRAAAAAAAAEVAAAGAEAVAAPAVDMAATSGAGTETARVNVPIEDMPTAAAATATASVRPPAEVTPEAPPADPGRRPEPAVTASRGGGRRTPIAVGLAVLALALLVGAVGAYLFLPSATIVVTPKTETIGPIQLTVVADPTTTEPDPTGPSVPAQTLSVDVTASDTFPATGKRVKATAATGTVTFKNFDPTSSNTVPAGSIVSTSGGVRFRTVESVTIGEATADLLPPYKLIPKEASVGVTAVKPGPDGNVGPNKIRKTPSGEGAFLLVTNPDATTGGTREEFPKITQKDVDAALAALEVTLQADFEAQVADPALAPAGTTVFPETATLGETTPSVDPATLVGTEVATFDLGLSATGTVLAVDKGPVASVADTHLRQNVSAGSELVEDSIDIVVGTPIVVGDQVSFPVTASATQVAVLDPAALKALVLGKTPAEAEAVLAPYGTAQITLSPDWVSTIPTFENRVDLSVDTTAVEAPGASASP